MFQDVDEIQTSYDDILSLMMDLKGNRLYRLTGTVLCFKKINNSGNDPPLCLIFVLLSSSFCCQDVILLFICNMYLKVTSFQTCIRSFTCRDKYKNSWIKNIAMTSFLLDQVWQKITVFGPGDQCCIVKPQNQPRKNTEVTLRIGQDQIVRLTIEFAEKNTKVLKLSELVGFCRVVYPYKFLYCDKMHNFKINYRTDNMYCNIFFCKGTEKVYCNIFY